MNDEQILEIIRGSLIEADPAAAERLADLSAGSTFDSLGLDSMMLINAIGIVENRFDVRFSPDDLVTLDTISGLIAIVRAELGR